MGSTCPINFFNLTDQEIGPKCVFCAGKRYTRLIVWHTVIAETFNVSGSVSHLKQAKPNMFMQTDTHVEVMYLFFMPSSSDDARGL